MRALSTHYPQHVASVLQHHQDALKTTEYDHAMIFSGGVRYQFQDDRTMPFAANPMFKWWAPLNRHPYSWIQCPADGKPRLFYYQPRDYWHLVPTDPQGYWTDHFDIVVMRSPDEVLKHWPDGRVAVIGELDMIGFDTGGDSDCAELIHRLHWARAGKTDYEIAALKEASMQGARAHTAAREAFERGCSEFDINRAYLAAIDATDFDVPYNNIVALNEHGAVLHYDAPQRDKPSQFRSFLIDAGAEVAGYASDITRTYSANPDLFSDMISAMDEAQLELCNMVTPGRDYVEIHLATHEKVAELLAQFDVIRCSAEQALGSGLTSTFFPHGVGHFLGLQVHDIGGHQATETGGGKPPPSDHPYLRLTRTLTTNAVVTIEPGLYFIDMLLDEHKGTELERDINWDRVAELKPFGGVRIEDNVVASAKGPRNLTREAFAELGA